MSDKYFPVRPLAKGQYRHPCQSVLLVDLRLISRKWEQVSPFASFTLKQRDILLGFHLKIA